MPEDRSYPPSDTDLKAFYQTPQWKTLAYQLKIACGWTCQCCGATADDARIVTDHVKPVRYFWHLRLEQTNLQVLCEDCNHGKASWDATDYRQSVKQRLLGSVAAYMVTERGIALKNAITSAYSFGVARGRHSAHS
jgi:5-methylcytosine-specific restriction endonuclease McrA